MQLSTHIYPDLIELETLMKNQKTNPQIPRNLKGEYLIKQSELISMLNDETHGYGYYHLTTWPSLCKMLDLVPVPDDTSKHRMLHFGAAVNMNDINDKRCGNNVFFTSFSFGPTENISMWTNYGIPNAAAVRVKFRRDSILKWIGDFMNGKIRVYGVDSSGLLTPLTTKVEVKHVNVTYWSKKDVGLNSKDPNEGLFFYNNAKYRLTDCRDVNKFMEERQYFFKEYGWNYEREVRLVLVFEEDLADQFKRVAVPFDGPLSWVLNDFSRYVMQGPWFNERTAPTTTAAGHRLNEAAPSRYSGLVKMRSVCDVCLDQIKENCVCPYRGQR